MRNKDTPEWFEEWFDSPFYHILYKNRDYKEAENFITNLIKYLAPKKDDLLLDIACGKGRHAIYLNKLGYYVDAFDLSANSIASAKKKETESLHFYTNDIRKPLKVNHYNYAFNLFTSFGYFKNEQDNQLSVNAMADSLKENGVLVLDFMNCNKVIENLLEKETKIVEGITFKLKRSVINGYITKDICFDVNNHSYHFQEKVKTITLNTFKKYFSEANLKIEAIFGDYKLSNFNKDTSDRLILVARKQ